VTVSEISEDDATARWDAILEQVEGGREFVIIRKGVAVARLIPGQHAVPSPAAPEEPFSSRNQNLAERIHQLFAPLGGADDLIIPPREPGREPPNFDDVYVDLPTEVSDWDSPETLAKLKAQAVALREQARAGGLRFEAYLPPSLADWLLGHIENGVFRDPSDAVFVMLGEQKELEPHADLRQEFLKRRIQTAIDDPRPRIPGEEVFARLKRQMDEPLPEPAKWKMLP
jgi:antitoxin ParD1/3/4